MFEGKTYTVPRKALMDLMRHQERHSVKRYVV
jgi:hypothetical protein